MKCHKHMPRMGEILINEFLGGYRFFGHWKQIRVFNKDQVKALIETWAGLDDCGITISTFKDGIPILLFIPFDFDGDLKTAYEDALKTYEFFIKQDYMTCLTYTGNRGFHVLVKAKPDYYSKIQLRTFQNAIKRMLKLETCDSQIFGDVRRLIRIPGTYHRKGGLCQILYEGGHKELDISQYVPNTIPTNGVIKGNYQEVYHEYPCVEVIVREDPEPPQLIRFAFVILRLAEGKSIQEIFEEIRGFGWIDFDEHKTLYQINHIASRDYKPPSCKTLQDLGYCIVKDCKYKSVRNAWLEKYPHLKEVIL